MKTIGQSPISIKQETNPCGGFRMRKIGKNYKLIRTLHDESERLNDDYLFSHHWSSQKTTVFDRWADVGYTRNFDISGTVNQYTHMTQSEVLTTDDTMQVDNTASFKRGDLVLIHQTQDGVRDRGFNRSLVGKWEYNRVLSTSGDTIQFHNNFKNNYQQNTDTDGYLQRTQLVRVIEGGIITASGTVTAKTWDGFSGGLVVIRARTKLDMNGHKINVSTQGFRGGVAGPGNNSGGTRGEGRWGTNNTPHSGNTLTNENQTGGGGEGGTAASLGGCGGGGGGHYTTGGRGTQNNGGNISYGGLGYGDEAFEWGIHFGSGGGGGGDDDDMGNPQNAGRGGGIILIEAGEIVNGHFEANGETAARPTSPSCGPAVNGSGAGGSIWLRANTIDILGNVAVTGGSVVKNLSDCNGDNNFYPHGGEGSDGRVRLDGTVTGNAPDQSNTYNGVLDGYYENWQPLKTHGPFGSGDGSTGHVAFNIQTGASENQPKKIRASFVMHHVGSWNVNQDDRTTVKLNGDTLMEFRWDGWHGEINTGWSTLPAPAGLGPLDLTGGTSPEFANCVYDTYLGGYLSSEYTLQANWEGDQMGMMHVTTDWIVTDQDLFTLDFTFKTNSPHPNEAGFISHMKIEEMLPENYDVEIESAPNTQIVMAEDKQSFYYESCADCAATYRGNWSDQNIHTITTDTLGTFVAHDLSASEGTLTVNNLPIHEEVRFSVYCHFVDTWDIGEGCVISCSDKDNTLQQRASWQKNWNYPRGGDWKLQDYTGYVDGWNDLKVLWDNRSVDDTRSKQQFGEEHWNEYGCRENRKLHLHGVEFVPDNYGSNQQNRTDTHNGYVKFVSAWMPHTHDSFQGQVRMTSNQSRSDEAGYVTHAHVEVRGGNRTIGLTRPVANDEFGNPFIATAEGRARTPEQSPAGKIVFDCFWPKYYNNATTWYTEWRDEWLTDKVNYPDGIYSSNVQGSWPFLCNVIKYTSATRQTKTNKVLYFNDAHSTSNSYGMPRFWPRVRDVPHKVLGVDVETPDHPVTSTARNAHRLWVQAQNKTHEQWLDWFNQYDTILWFGTNRTNAYDKINWLDQSTDNLKNFESAFVDYINGGGGMMCCTDSYHFTMTVNTLVKYFGVKLDSNIARTANVNMEPYKIKTFLKNTEYIPTGFHPLFADMHPEQAVVGGGSDGEIIFIHNDRITSVYATDSSGKLTITQHTGTTYGGDNKTSNKSIETGNLLIRTPNDCGAS